MNNLLNNCKIVNIVWIDRGIILSIIYFILKYYDELTNKIIIITEDIYRIYIKTLFPKLQIEDYSKHRSNNFYFNIRKIIRNQDIVIDFIRNYKSTINTSKIHLVPWFDMNDPLIAFKINNKKNLKTDKYITFINNFSKCSRGNYLNNIWDVIMENKIMKMYNKFNPTNSLINQINLFNQFIQKNYKYLTYPSIQYPKVYYQNVIPQMNIHLSNPVAGLGSATGLGSAAGLGPTGFGSAGLAPAAGLGPAGLGPAGLGPAGLGPAGLGPAAGLGSAAGLGPAGLGPAGLGPAAGLGSAAGLGHAAGLAPAAGLGPAAARINQLENQIKNIVIDNQQKMDDLINILNNKINLINNLI
jgi:hypothetical protein